MYIYLQFDLCWWHPQKAKENLGLTRFRRPWYKRPGRILLTGSTPESNTELLLWCQRNIKSMRNIKIEGAKFLTKIEQHYPLTRNELRLLTEEMSKFFCTGSHEPDNLKEAFRTFRTQGLTECSIVIREQAFPLDDVF